MDADSAVQGLAADPGSSATPARDAKEVASDPRRSDPPPSLPAVDRTPERTAAPQPSAAERYRDELIDAINYGNEEQNYAQLHLDVTALPDAFTGRALEMHVAAVAQLYQLGVVSFNTMLSQQFGAFQVDPSETTAEVYVVERWTSEFRNAITGLCVSRIPPWDVPQTVALRRNGDDWIIENILLSATMPSAVPC